MLKIASYTASNNAKDKRIGVPFAPSQSVNINATLSSPFINPVVNADATKEGAGSNVSKLICFVYFMCRKLGVLPHALHQLSR